MMMQLARRVSEWLSKSPRIRRWRMAYPPLCLWELPGPPSSSRLVAVIFLAAGCWFMFFGITQEVIANGPLVRADLRVLPYVQTLRTADLDRLMLFFTSLESWQVIVAGAGISGALLYLSRRWWWLGAMLTVLVGEQLLSQSLKMAFHRTRPSLDNALVLAAGGSYPSGHTLAGSVFFGFQACFVIAQSRSWLIRLAVACFSVLLMFFIGLSRIYLGVHWPSDVLASWTLGPAWAATVLVIFHVKRVQVSTHHSRSVPGWQWTAGLCLWFRQ